MDNKTSHMSKHTIEKEQSQSKSKKLPPYAVIIYNDNEHSFPYVIDCFQKVFRYQTLKSTMLAKTIHQNGQAIVWTGSKEVAELKRDQIIGMGPDFYGPKPIKFPLKVRIEPLNQG